MDPSELLVLVAQRLQRLDIAYFTTGSIASTIYGEPRFTNDVDIVIRLDESKVAALCAAFPEEDFYVSADAMREAVRRHSQFNVIHPSSGYKIDFMVAMASEFNESRFSRTRPIEIADGVRVQFASPEDVIIKKLEYYQIGGSSKHETDIQGIIRLADPPLDLEYVANWAARMGLMPEWEKITHGMKS